MQMPTDEHAEMHAPAAFARLAPEQQVARHALHEEEQWEACV